MKTKVIIVIDHPENTSVNDVVELTLVPWVDSMLTETPDGWGATITLIKEEQ